MSQTKTEKSEVTETMTETTKVMEVKKPMTKTRETIIPTQPIPRKTMIQHSQSES